VRVRFINVLVSVLVLGFLIPAEANATRSIDSRLDAVLSATSGRSAVVALHRGRVIGSATRDADLQTPLHLASVSKTVTAAAVMRLAERGDINLSAPIGDYLRKFFADGNDEIAAQPVSAFLNHATGLRSNNLRAVTNGLTTWQKYAAQAGAGRVNATRGRYLYSNDNYVLLTKLVVEMTDMPFSVAVRELVWEPLGVDGGRLDVATRAIQVLGGAGAWVASARAVATLFDALNPDSPGPKLLSPRWLTRMHSVAHAAEYRNGLRFRGGAWGHTGSLHAVRSAAVVTKSGTVYVVLSEGARPSKSERLFDALARLG
jgi:CubicO group peptidase (beta-lactamase class C family)